MKKILSLSLCLAVILSLIPAFALNIGAAEQTLDSDLNERISKTHCDYNTLWNPYVIDKDNQYDSKKVKIVNNVVYYLDKDRYVCISLIDSKESAEKKEITIVDKIDNIPVTQIMDLHLFDMELKAEKITLPDTIEEISQSTFSYCNNLKTINLPDSIKRIGICAFSGTKISSITVPKNLETTLDVGGGETGTKNNKSGWCFSSMPELVSVVVPNTIKHIPEGMFANCKKLSKVTIEGAITSIGDLAFYRTNINNSFKIPQTVQEIGEMAFAHCKSFNKIKLPKRLKSIWDGAFSNLDIKQINIPKSCKYIYGEAFDCCYKLTKVTFNGKCALANGFDGEGAWTFAGCRNLKTIKGSKYITTMYGYDFENCKSLTSFTISKNLKAIGDYVFKGCTGMKKIKILTKKTKLFAHSKGIFKKVPATCKAYVKTKAMAKTIKDCGFKGKVIINKNLK